MNRASGSRSSKGKEQQAAVSEEPVFPSREKFGQLYQTLRRVCPITEDGHTERLAVMMGWPIEKIMFMLHVFEELELVCVQEQQLMLIPDPVKRELTYSAAYREELRKSSPTKFYLRIPLHYQLGLQNKRNHSNYQRKRELAFHEFQRLYSRYPGLSKSRYPV